MLSESPRMSKPSFTKNVGNTGDLAQCYLHKISPPSQKKKKKRKSVALKKVVLKVSRKYTVKIINLKANINT